MYFCCTLLKYFAFICGSVCAEFTNFMSKVFMSNTKYLWTTAALHVYNSYDVGYLRNVIKHWNRNWNIVVAMSLPSFLFHFWFWNTLKIFAIPSLDNLGQHFIFFDTKTIFYFNSFCLFLGKFVKNYSFSLVLCHYFGFFFVISNCEIFYNILWMKGIINLLSYKINIFYKNCIKSRALKLKLYVTH